MNEAAFQATERARARTLLDLLRESRINLRADVAPALLQQETGLQQKILSLTPRPDDPQKEKLLAANKETPGATLEELQKVRARIRQASPRFADLTEPQPPSVQEIQTQLLDPDTLLLAYSLGEKRSFLFTITDQTFRSYELPGRAEIETAAKRFYELLTARSRTVRFEEAAPRAARIRQAEQELATAGRELSRMILSPVAAEPGNKRLVIVADGMLQYVPFAALPNPSVVRRPLSVVKGDAPRPADNGQRTTDYGQPLIVTHEIITLPSVSVMMLLRSELAARKPAPKAVAVLADPVFEASDPRVKAAASANNQKPGTAARLSPLARSLRSFDDRAGLTRLLLSRDEAEAIASAVPASERLKALDFRASRAAAVSAELSQYRIVHFATHGLVNTQQPELSGLVFSLVDETGKPQDGFLQAHEIFNLKLPAELVVLSACQTGLGREVKGEGLVSLTRGFMYAGAARVVASQWRVDDYATSVLMKKFYRGMLQEKLPAAAALRKAQIEMLQQQQWRSPFYWAAFVLQGEWK
ncbi:MAG: CHAT domain-containing protein [Blastocatellia bacterium]